MATIPATNLRTTTPAMPLDGIMLAEELLDLAERAQAYTNATGVAVALWRGQDLLVRTSTGNAPDVGSAIPAADDFIAECLTKRKPLCCRDTDSEGRIGPVLRAMKTRSLIVVPICGQPLARGVMLVIAPLPNAFQPTHTAILMTLSDIISSKLAARDVPEEIDLINDPPPAISLACQPAPAATVMEMPPITPVEAAPAPAPATETQPAPVQSSSMKPERHEVLWDLVNVAKDPADALAKFAAAKASASQPPPHVPAALLKDEPLRLVEDKKSEPDPALLDPALDPLKFRPEPVQASAPVAPSPEPEPVKIAARPALQSEPVKMAPKVTAPTIQPEPVKIAAKPALQPEPVKIAPKLTAASLPPEPVKVAPKLTPPLLVAKTATVSAPMPMPVLTTWDVQPEKSEGKRLGAPVIAVTATLVIVAALWMYRSTPSEVAPPVIPVPAAPALAVPAAPEIKAPAPAAAISQPAVTREAVVQPVVRETIEVKATRIAEAPAVKPAVKEEAEPQPVMEIAAAQPKPKAEPLPEMAAPKLMPAAHDNLVANLSKVQVAMPAAPKSELAPAQLLSQVAPVYPAFARQSGVTGTVKMNITIGPEGSVTAVRVTDGPLQLRGAASDAVRQWRYRPATLGGKPVESSANVQIKFTR